MLGGEITEDKYIQDLKFLEVKIKNYILLNSFAGNMDLIHFYIYLGDLQKEMDNNLFQTLLLNALSNIIRLNFSSYTLGSDKVEKMLVYIDRVLYFFGKKGDKWLYPLNNKQLYEIYCKAFAATYDGYHTCEVCEATKLSRFSYSSLLYVINNRDYEFKVFILGGKLLSFPAVQIFEEDFNMKMYCILSSDQVSLIRSKHKFTVRHMEDL